MDVTGRSRTASPPSLILSTIMEFTVQSGLSSRLMPKMTGLGMLFSVGQDGGRLVKKHAALLHLHGTGSLFFNGKGKK